MRRVPQIPIALAVALALIASGCGDDDGDAATTTVTENATGPETAPEETAEDGRPPPADVEVDELTAFRSPTGNIVCLIEPLGVRCDIDERGWSPPEAPPGCELDYGQGIELTTGGTADFVCAGDTTLGSDAEELPNGQSIAAGLVRCESTESGIRCEDIETGRGFEISREDYAIF